MGRRWRRSHVIAAGIILATPLAVPAEIFHYVGPDGVLVLTNAPPEPIRHQTSIPQPVDPVAQGNAASQEVLEEPPVSEPIVTFEAPPVEHVQAAAQGVREMPADTLAARKPPVSGLHLLSGTSSAGGPAATATATETSTTLQVGKSFKSGD